MQVSGLGFTGFGAERVGSRYRERVSAKSHETVIRAP